LGNCIIFFITIYYRESSSDDSSDEEETVLWHEQRRRIKQSLMQTGTMPKLEEIEVPKQKKPEKKGSPRRSRNTSEDVTPKPSPVRRKRKSEASRFS